MQDVDGHTAIAFFVSSLVHDLRQVRPGQTSDPTSGFATATGYQSAAGGGASVAPTPVLGGGKTPLVGDNKVCCVMAHP